MCGIFGIINNNYDNNNNKSNLIKYRGPENTIVKSHPKKYFFCFHRLCINDLSEEANQPFETDEYIIMCNGEIYNYKQLIKTFNLDCKTNSDCEVICKLYEIMNVVDLCKLLDGVFACCIYDKKKEVSYLFRDRIGVRPLFYETGETGKDDDIYLKFASEAKCLDNNILQLTPSTILVYDILENDIRFDKFYELPMTCYLYKQETVIKHINKLLTNSVNKRLLSDRPIGCLLSGGLDSSIIASLLTKLSNKPIKTFSVGFKDSVDLVKAKQVSEYLKTDHYELILDYDDAIKQIPNVIKCLESYDVTTIRASIGMYLLSKYISENHPEKVIFSGEGADEIFGGYLYFHKVPSPEDFFHESYRLVTELPYFDVLRADRCTSHFGLELRVPFLDKDMISYCMSLNPELRKPTQGIEKYILRQAFKDNYLPEHIVYRKKEAFSDGVGGEKKPFFSHIHDYIRNLDEYKKIENIDHLEMKYYKDIFDSYYNFPCIPHYWMPNWVENVFNPSARIL
jgi:asparagine synthase (glutamine-hydrolysing)